jgi:hypothetical protein
MFFTTSFPLENQKLLREFGFDGKNISIGPNPTSARSIRELWKLLEEFYKISAVEVVKQFQDTFSRKSSNKVIGTRDNFRKSLELRVNPLHKIKHSNVRKEWSGTNTEIHQSLLILLQKLQSVENVRNLSPGNFISIG